MTEAQLDALINEDRKGGWRRSARGNLTRGSPRGARLTVFERPVGSDRFHYSIAECNRVIYSPRHYRSEGDAIEAVMAICFR